MAYVRYSPYLIKFGIILGISRSVHEYNYLACDRLSLCLSVSLSLCLSLSFLFLCFATIYSTGDA